MERVTFSEPQIATFQLSYFGRDADENRLDMYDAAASFYGFARTVAILGHFYSTGTVNAHAPRSEVKVYLEATESGSYKQTIAAAALGAVISAPLYAFVTRVLESWIPTPDQQTEKIIDLLQEQNRLLKSTMLADDEYSEDAEKINQEKVASDFIKEHQDSIQVIRSITANSFKDIFRPVGKSCDYTAISYGRDNAPIGAVNPRSLRLIEADRPDDEVVSILGVVSSFSRSSKTGVVFSREIGREFRIQHSTSERLPAEDSFSWSQYYQRPIRMNGRFVRFFDGKIKKLLVYTVERLTGKEIDEYRKIGIDRS